jgi:hypothetical protein
LKAEALFFRLAKEESSFLKKRSKKLFPRAQRGFATTCFARESPSAAGIPVLGCLRRWALNPLVQLRAKHPGKVLGLAQIRVK